MSIEVLNTKAAWIVVGALIGLPAAGYGVYKGVEYGIHVHHTMLVHTAENMTYSLSDCAVNPGSGGTHWSADVLVHNGNPDRVGQYGVQVEFLDADDKPLTWTRVVDVPSMAAGETKNLTVAEDVSQDSPSHVTCKAVFFYKGHPANELAPQQIGQ